jgi:hypothetical protein
LKRADTIEILKLRHGRVLGTGAGMLAIVTHQSSQLAQGQASFLVHTDKQGRRYGKPTLPHLANLRRIDIKPRRELPIVTGTQQLHEGIEK